MDITGHMNPIIIEIKSPEDILYPCGRELFEDPQVLYHGTSSVYAPSIERDGWLPNYVPYNMHDIRVICDIHESLAFYGTSGGGYPVLKGFTLGNDGIYSEYKPASFSESYWRARNYAARPGGETVDSIVQAVEDIELLLRDAERLEEHKRELQDKFDEREKYFNPLVAEYQSAIERIGKVDYLKQCLHKAIAFKEKYRDIVNRHLPVVYCVRIEPELIETGNGKERHDTMGFDRERFERMFEIRPRQGVHVSPERIVARIDFPNGVSRWLPFAGEILPLAWLVTGDQTKKMWDKHRRIFGTEVG
ncbi:MAG: hypothetical protein HYX81_00695 [Chloroflexi bacterium]|nr:hypothetical protein [Chloroflexota bacterium]